MQRSERQKARRFLEPSQVPLAQGWVVLSLLEDAGIAEGRSESMAPCHSRGATTRMVEA